MNQSLEQHVAEWWAFDNEIEKTGRKMAELQQQQFELEADQCLSEERINQAAGNRESMVFEVSPGTYVILAWQEYSEDFTIALLEGIR